MQIHANLTAAVTLGAALPFRIRQIDTNEALLVAGTPDGATVQLYLSNEDTGMYTPAMDPYGTEIAKFVNVTGLMLLEHSQTLFGKIVVSGGGGSQDLSIWYGGTS